MLCFQIEKELTFISQYWRMTSWLRWHHSTRT